MVNKKNIICEVKFGSTLYGTRTEDSDDDIKGIFLPTKKDILLGKISNSINIQQEITNPKMVKMILIQSIIPYTIS